MFRVQSFIKFLCFTLLFTTSVSATEDFTINSYDDLVQTIKFVENLTENFKVEISHIFNRISKRKQLKAVKPQVIEAINSTAEVLLEIVKTNCIPQKKFKLKKTVIDDVNTSSITEANTGVIGVPPDAAMGALYQTLGHSLEDLEYVDNTYTFNNIEMSSEILTELQEFYGK